MQSETTERTISHMIVTMNADRELSRSGDYATQDEDETFPILHVALVRVAGEPDDPSEQNFETRLWAANGIDREPAFGDGQPTVYRGDKRDRVLVQFAGAIASVEHYDDDSDVFMR